MLYVSVFMILEIILVIILLSVLILVHELGHFLAAKKFGLLVKEFGIGLPPRFWGKKIGETIYSINWLPFGGFVKILGEDGKDSNFSDSEKIEATSVMVEEKVDSKAEEIEIKMEKITTITTGSLSRSFTNLPASKQAIILCAGVLMNFLAGWFIVSLVLLQGVPRSVIIANVASGSPASAAGFQAGDQIVNAHIGPQKLADSFSLEQASDFIKSASGKNLSLEISRAGERMEINVTPRLNPPQGEGPLGVALIEGGTANVPFPENFWQGLKLSLEIVKTIFIAVFNLIKGAFIGKANLEGVAGPVGVVRIAAQAGQTGFIYLFQLIGIISLNLAVINILPFPALDGGRLLFLAIKKTKGSPLPAKVEQYVNIAGLILLLGLVVFLSIRDVLGIFFKPGI